MADIKIYSGKGYFTGEEETVEYTEEELAEMGNPPTFQQYQPYREEQTACV